MNAGVHSRLNLFKKEIEPRGEKDMHLLCDPEPHFQLYGQKWISEHLCVIFFGDDMKLIPEAEEGDE
jgi:hypothetical protein